MNMWPGYKFGALTRVLLLMSWACAALVATIPAKATVVDYVWNNNGGLLFASQNTTVAISGHFSYDTLTTGISNIDVTLSPVSGFAGCVCVGHATQGSVSFVNAAQGITTLSFTYFSPAAGGTAQASFLLDTPVLGGPGPYYIGGGIFGIGSVFTGVGLGGAFSLVDSPRPPFIAQALASVPEPGSWMLLLSGFFLSAVLLRRDRKFNRGGGGALLLRAA